MRKTSAILIVTNILTLCALMLCWNATPGNSRWQGSRPPPIPGKERTVADPFSQRLPDKTTTGGKTQEVKNVHIAETSLAGKAVNHPKYPLLQRRVEEQTLDYRYAALFKRLRLPPEKLQLLKAALIERELAGADIHLAQGTKDSARLSPAEEMAMAAKEKDNVDAYIASHLTSEETAIYTKYQETLAARRETEALATRVGYEVGSLTDEQVDALANIIANLRSPARIGTAEFSISRLAAEKAGIENSSVFPDSAKISMLRYLDNQKEILELQLEIAHSGVNK